MADEETAVRGEIGGGAARNVGGEVRIVGAERRDGLELRTRGLADRGLPELRAEGLPPYLGQGWARILAELARRVAASGGRPPEEVELAPDVAIRLTPDAGELVAVPPHGFTGPEGDWRREVVLRLFPSAGS
jgi:hypothetical protein